MSNYLNWANRLTILRILFIPIFAISLLYHRYGTALLIFCLAGVSDGLDGFIARSYGQKTKLGTFLDPVADLLLLSTAFIVLSVLDRIPVWLAVIVISRNVIVVMGSAILFIINEYMKISITPLGKATTFFQLVLILFTLFSHYFGSMPETTFTVLLWTTTILTVISGLQYIAIGTGSINGNNGKKKDTY
jgi:cardiolipin synthase